MPPAALISAAAIFEPSDTPRPTNAAGPVMIFTSPILISVSLTPGSPAHAAVADSSAAASTLVAIFIVSSLVSSLVFILFSKHDPEKWNPVFRQDHAPLVCQRPVAPVFAGVVPEADQSVGLEAQEQHDDEPVGDAANFVDVIGVNGRSRVDYDRQHQSDHLRQIR